MFEVITLIVLPIISAVGSIAIFCLTDETK